MDQKINRTIFIASASEDVEISRIILRAFNKANLAKRSSIKFNLEPIHWEDVDHDFNKDTLNSLVRFPQKYDYGCFLFTPNDTIISRDVATKRVRDNVLFEFGLFVSQKDGLERSFIIHPEEADIKLASDLNGIATSRYIKSNNPEALAGHVQTSIDVIFRKIIEYEEKLERASKEAVKNSIAVLKNTLQNAKEDSQPEIILDALKDLAEVKAKALHQSASEVLKDILTWINTLVDIMDVNEMAKLQSGDLKSAWIYSSLPIEFNINMGEFREKFQELVKENLVRGVKYTYFTDNEMILDDIKKMGRKYIKQIEVYILDPSSMISNFVFHYFKDGSYSVLQNIVRRGELESLLRLEPSDARKLKAKVDSQLHLYEESIEDGLVIYRKCDK